MRNQSDGTNNQKPERHSKFGARKIKLNWKTGSFRLFAGHFK